jgi:dipeptidyl-peptidase-4
MTRPYEHLTLEQVARYPRPGMATPGQWGFSPDGRSVTYLFSEEGSLVRSLWAYDIETGRRMVLARPPPASTSEGALSREEELRRERARQRELGVTSYQFASKSDVPVLLIPSGAGLQVRSGDGPLRTLEGTAGAVDPRLSPDGRGVAFVRDNDLHVVEVASGQIVRLTADGEEAFSNGLAEFIAQEELDRAEGYWWSPDSTQVAFERADSRHIPLLPITHTGTPKPDAETHRYPFAGERNAVVSLGILTLGSGETRWLDLGPDDDQYLARVHWRPDGALAAELLSRDQRRWRLVLFDVATRALATLIEERSVPWYNLDHDFRFLEDGSFLRSSERTGFRHLYLHAPDGSLLRQLTEGEWIVSRLVALDEPRRLAYFQGTREGALERHIDAVSLDGGPVTRLTNGNGWHDGVFSRDCARWVDTHASVAHAPVATLREVGGAIVATLFDNAGTSAEALGLRPPEFITIPAADGTPLHGAIYHPEKASGPAPVIVSVYGGPHAQRVADDWSLTVDLRAQYLAQQGFLVFKLDNRGSANRGRAFEAHLAAHMGSVEVEDQAAGVRYLAAQGLADAARAGIYGWSYGGYMTCMAMLREPSLFRAGVAGAPVTDWDGYDTAYTERYMQTPQSNAEGYHESSVLTHAANLQGKLLLVHGLVDENVHFRHTARLINALIGAQKDYDLLVFPEGRHMPRDAAGLEYMERRLVEYFQQHL